MAKPNVKTWSADFDAASNTINYSTKVDDVIRQSVCLDRFPVAITEVFAWKGCKVVTDERNSDLPSASIQATMDARETLWKMWETGQWTKDRVGGGFSTRIEYDALAELKKTTVGAIQTELGDKDKYTKEAKEKILASKVVQDKVKEIQARTAENSQTLDFTAELAEG